MDSRWIDLTGAVNVRDLGGLPAGDGGVTRFGRAFRSDNLQSLTDDDVDRLTRVLGVRDVVDLRADIEVTSQGPGPLTLVSSVTIHHLSLYPKPDQHSSAASIPPWLNASEPSFWADVGGHYASYLKHRPENIVTALRTMAGSEGAVITHCAAGKDRTGIVCAMALSAVGVEPEAIVDDYAQTGERIEAILARLETAAAGAIDYRSGQPDDSHRPRADAMHAFLGRVGDEFGGTLGWLERHGWTSADTDALRTRLLD